MRRLIDEPKEIPEDAQPVCAEVCRAVEEWDGNPEGLEFLAAYQFGRDWYTASRYVPRNSRCGRLIQAACDALALRSAAFVSGGRLWSRAQIGEHDGKVIGGDVIIWPESYEKESGRPVYPYVQERF